MEAARPVKKIMTNGDLLTLAEKEIVAVLEDARTSKANAAILRTQQLVISFLRQGQDDHEKVQKMWTAYQALKWVSILLGGSVIALIWSLITGQVQLVFM